MEPQYSGSPAQNPTHTYTAPGVYPVALQAYNTNEYFSAQKAGYITATSSQMVANFTADFTTGPAPLSVSFTDQSENATGWAWFFGDETYIAPWTEKTASAAWPARNGHSSVAMPDGSIVLMGGNVLGTGWSNDVWRSTDNGATWTEQTAGAAWSPRYNQGSVTMPDGSILLIGGNATDGLKNDVWRSIDNGATWTEQTASAAWSPRFGSSSVAMSDGSILLTGGYNYSVGHMNDTWRSTDEGATWNLVNASSGWPARFKHTSVAMSDGSIVLMGGESSSGTYNDTWRSTDSGTTWTEMNASSGWSQRFGSSSVAMPDGSIVLTGGYDTWDLNDVWRSTDEGATWTPLPDAGWPSRFGHTSMAMPDGSIVVMGGGGSGGSGLYNDVWRLTPAGSSVQDPSHTYTTPGVYPVALQAYNAYGFNSTRKTGYITVTGTVAGPKPITGFSGTPTSGPAPLPVSFTDLSTDSPTGWAWYFGDETYTAPWTPVNMSSGWPARAYHSVVSMPDGSFVLMAGYDGTRRYNDTWLSTDGGSTWMCVNKSSGWSARDKQKVVLLPDNSIILMGGTGKNGIELNDTWRSTDNGTTWQLMNASSGWPARHGFMANPLSNGTILLFGGYDGTTYYNDMWSSTDNGATWSKVSASAPWSPRAIECSRKDEGSLVLEGGSNAGGYLNDTWRSTDNGTTWQPMNPSSGWPARTSHVTRVNPDGSILLFGGYDGTTYYNDLWLTTNEGANWTEVNASASWTARLDPTAASNLDGSIVAMGGFDGTNYYNDTWRLNTSGSSAQDPSHAYTLPGIYNVSLQAFNAFGRNVTRQAGYITVTAPAASPKPITGFSADVTSGKEPLAVSFTDLSLNNPTGWAWFFGDENFTAPWTQQTAGAAWPARYLASSVALPDGSIVMMAGTMDNSQYSFMNDVWRSTDKGATWTEVNASPGWSGRSAPSSVALPDGSIVLMGGVGYGGGFWHDVWRSTDDGATWTRQTASPGWSARGYQSSVALPDGSIVLMGGENSTGFTNDVWRSTDKGATWTQQTASAGWSARADPASVVLPDGSIILMGGDVGGYANDVWRSTDRGATWTEVTSYNGWSGRTDHTLSGDAGWQHCHDGRYWLAPGLPERYVAVNGWRRYVDTAPECRVAGTGFPEQRCAAGREHRADGR